MYASQPQSPAQRGPRDRALRACYSAAALAVTAAGVAVAAGLAFLLVGPAEGSTSEFVLAWTAAASGITSGLLFATAAIVAQTFGLWARFPTSVRVAAWVVLIAGFVLSIARSLI